jgi:hypothetical protein
MVAQEGPIRLSEAFGAFQPGDLGSMFLTVMPPNGSYFWTPHIHFRLRALSDGVEVAEAWTQPPQECPPAAS